MQRRNGRRGAYARAAPHWHQVMTQNARPGAAAIGPGRQPFGARAGIRPGDVILTVDGERVLSRVGFLTQVKDRAGRESNLDIDRDGVRLEKRVAIGSP
jgi:S1-C subfamily serine protease